MIWRPFVDAARRQNRRDPRPMRAAFALLALAAVAALSPPVSAEPNSAPPYMREGEEVRGPTGFYDLCARVPWECPAPPPQAASADVRVVVGSDGVATLSALNGALNAAFTAATDNDIYGVSDYWAMPIEAADCEDFVLAKRAALLNAGWPPHALLIGVVRGVATPYHAVLIVRTDRGEFVLDNLRDEVVDWRAAGYDWVVRQSLSNPQRWVRILSADSGSFAKGPIALGSNDSARR